MIHYCLQCDKYYPTDNHQHETVEFPCDNNASKNGTKPFTILRNTYLLRRHATMLREIALRGLEEE